MDVLHLVPPCVSVAKRARKHEPTQNEEEDMDEGIDINDGPISVRITRSTEDFYQEKYKEVRSSNILSNRRYPE